MHDLLKDLSHLANTKHIRVTRKAKQIAGSYQNNIAEQNKMVVLPALRQWTVTSHDKALESVFGDLDGQFLGLVFQAIELSSLFIDVRSQNGNNDES